jgi:rRNA maturation RNase YbeY
LAVNYFSEKSDFKFKNKRKTTNWLKTVISSNRKIAGELSFIFCTDEHLLEINKTYLKHFYLTDVITFNYNVEDVINGDIYISVDRISENAHIFGVSFDSELYRIMVHGILHLLGFNDKTKKQEKQMRDLEDFYLKEILKK